MSETPQQNNLKQFFRGSKQSAPTKDTDAAPNPSKKQRRIQVDISPDSVHPNKDDFNMLTDFKKQIRTSVFYTSKEVQKDFNPDEALHECKYYFHLLLTNETIPLPNDTQYQTFVAAQNELKILHNVTPRSPDFFSKAYSVQQKIESHLHTIRPMFEHLVKAVDCYHKSQHGMELCKQNKNYIDGMKWESMSNTLMKIGVKECIDHVAYERMEKQKNKKESKKLVSSAVAARAADSSDSVESSECDDDHSKTSLETLSSQNLSATEIIDLEGNVIETNDILKTASKGERGGSTNVRKYTNKSSKTSMPSTKGALLTESQFQKLVNKAWQFAPRSTKGKESKTFSGKNKKGHGLVLINGRLNCSLCGVPVAKVAQHLCTEMHQKCYNHKVFQQKNNTNLNSNVMSQQTTQSACDDIENRKTNSERGMNSSVSDNVYRTFVLKTSLKANLSMGQLQRMIPALDAKGGLKPDLGHTSNLVSDYIRNVKSDMKKDVTRIINESYKEFTLTIDGSPVGDDAEAICIRLIRKKNLKVIDLLLSLKLYNQKPSGEQIAKNVIIALREHGYADLSGWRVVIMDRAGNNGVALKDLQANTLANPVYSPCHSHTVNLPGKEFSKSCELMEKFRKHWNKAMLNRGQLFKHVKALIGRSPIISGGVRWYIQWEQVKDLNEISIETIIKDVIPIALEYKWSEKSVNKLNELISEETLPLIMVELAAVADIGKIFCETTYVLEGDDPLGCCSWMAFENLDRYVEEGVKLNSATINACDKAGELANEVLAKLQSISTAKISEVEQHEHSLKESIDALKKRIEAKENATSLRGGGRRRVNYAALNSGFTQNNSSSDTTTITMLKEQLQKEEDDLKKNTEIIQKLNENHGNISAKLGPTSTLQFQQYAIEKVKCAFEKHIALYKDDYSRDASLDYPLYHSKLAFKANKIFDILYLKECIANNTPITQLNSLIDNLNHHKEETFTPRYLSEMKSELPKLLQFVSEFAFDFDADVEDSHLYENRLKKRARNVKNRHAMEMLRENRGDETMNSSGNALEMLRLHDESNYIDSVLRMFPSDWRKDAGERSNRVAQWWSKFHSQSSGTWLPNFEKAFRLACLLRQPSSAIVERVFSQVSYIRSICGDRTKEDNLELRAQLRCNEENIDDYDV